MPHTLRAVDRNSEVLAALRMLSGFDDDISRDCTRTVNRLRSLLTQIYPSLKRVFAGSTRTHTPTLDLLIHYTGPTGLKKTGCTRVLAWLSKRSRHNPDVLVDSIFVALAARTVTVPGTEAAELVIPQLAANIKALKTQRETIVGQVDGVLEDIPASEVLDRIRRESASRPQHENPAFHRWWIRLRILWPPGRLCRNCSCDTKIRLINTRRVPIQNRKQATEKCAVLLKRLLPFEATKHPEPTTGAKEQKANATMRPTHVPNQTQMQRHLRHAQKQGILPRDTYQTISSSLSRAAIRSTNTSWWAQ